MLGFSFSDLWHVYAFGTFNLVSLFIFLDFGFIKVDSTTKAGEDNEVEFKSNASHNVGSGKLAGNLDVKYKIPKYGEFTFLLHLNSIEQPDTDCRLNAAVTADVFLFKIFVRSCCEF